MQLIVVSGSSADGQPIRGAMRLSNPPTEWLPLKDRSLPPGLDLTGQSVWEFKGKVGSFAGDRSSCLELIFSLAYCVQVYIFGGTDSDDTLQNSLWKWDLKTSQFQEISPVSA